MEDHGDPGENDRSFTTEDSSIINNVIVGNGSTNHDADSHGCHIDRDHLVDHMVVPKLGIDSNKEKMLKVVVYGSVNALMAIPPLFGYAAIIFRCELTLQKKYVIQLWYVQRIPAIRVFWDTQGWGLFPLEATIRVFHHLLPLLIHYYVFSARGSLPYSRERDFLCGLAQANTKVTWSFRPTVP